MSYIRYKFNYLHEIALEMKVLRSKLHIDQTNFRKQFLIKT